MTIKVFEIYIKAPPEAIWSAITDPAMNARYAYQAPMKFELRKGGQFIAEANAMMQQMGMPKIAIDGEVLEIEVPRRLVHTYRWLFNDAHKAEGFTTVTWDVVPTEAGFTRLTLTHDLNNATQMSSAVASQFNMQGGGGWTWILSDLKTLLETGKTMGEH